MRAGAWVDDYFQHCQLKPLLNVLLSLWRVLLLLFLSKFSMIVDLYLVNIMMHTTLNCRAYDAVIIIVFAIVTVTVCIVCSMIHAAVTLVGSLALSPDALYA